MSDEDEPVKKDLTTVLQVYIIPVVVTWIMFSLVMSFATVDSKLCDKDYPLGQIFHTKLFCEIKK